MRSTTRKHLLTVVAGGAFMIAVLLGVLFFAGIWTVGNRYKVTAYVYNARGVGDGATVFEAGLPVGRVTNVQRRGPDAVLTLRVDKGVRPLPVDSQVELGLRSLAGEADVLLRPGHSAERVHSGGSLGLSRNREFTEVDQILTELSGPTETATRQVFQGVGAGLDGQGHNLNHTLRAFSNLANNSPALTSTMAAQHEQVADVVENLGTVMRAISDRSGALAQFARGSLTTFRTIAGRNAAFQRMLAKLPAAIGSSRDLVQGVNTTSGRISPMLSNLADAAITLKPAFDRMTPGARSGLAVVDALGSASPQLKGLLASLVKLEPATAQAMPALHAATCQVNPMVRFAAPYAPAISAFASNWGSDLTAYGNPAHQMMANVAVDPSHLFRGIESKGASDALNTLFNFGIFRKAGGGTSYHTVPVPFKQSNVNTEGQGTFGMEEWARSHKYPHVTADCAK